MISFANVIPLPDVASVIVFTCSSDAMVYFMLMLLFRLLVVKKCMILDFSHVAISIRVQVDIVEKSGALFLAVLFIYQYAVPDSPQNQEE